MSWIRGKVGRCVLAAFVVGLVACTAASAIDFDPVQWCQVRLSVMGRKFFRQWSGEIALCFERRMKGEIPPDSKCYPEDIQRTDPTTYCQPATDPNVDPNYQRRLCRAEDHSHQKIQRKCRDEYLSDIQLGVPCGTVAQLQDCIDFEAHGHDAVDFTRTLFGNTGRIDDEAQRDCMTTIFTVGQTYARKVMQILGDKCEVFVMAGKLGGPCPDKGAQKKLNKARRGFAKGVLSACQQDLDNHVFTFGAPCDKLGPAATASDYVNCLSGVAEDVAIRGVSTVWYGN
jgi:hypothetical protein